MEHHMNDPVSLKALPWFLKAVLVVVGAVFALVLSGDIDSNGNIKISVKFLASLAFAVSFSYSKVTQSITVECVNHG